ncbi:MAG: ABC transporter permease [Betaproteobacteria bacterium SG8_40]|jgi:branched-chain amino acid transport system permease protein|nr:MAG: ABC transporter permease [Betaproteobacteria bacterium SG8_40]
MPSTAAGTKPTLLWVAALLLWAALPFVATRHMVDLLVFAGLYSIAGLGVAFLLGQCGIVNLAQSVFYGIGAYSVAWFCARKGLPVPVGIASGIVLSVAMAAVVGWPILRLSGYFLALATLALGIIAQVLFLEWDWITGGTLGIGGIPFIEILGFTFDTPARFYFLVWPVALLLLVLHHNLLHSRAGLALRAMRDEPDAAAVLGIDIHKLKVQMFMLSAMLGSLAGSLFAHYVTFVSVDSFAIDRAISFLLLAVLGGVYTVWGPVLGALFITILPQWLSRLGDIHAFVFAAALIAAVILLPEGFGGAVTNWWQRRRTRRA